MRTRAFIDGVYTWVDHGEGYGGSVKIRGELVVGGTRPAKGAGLTPSQKAPAQGRCRAGRPRLSPDVELGGRGKKYATEEERGAARRQAWRDSEARKRQEQRDHRSKLRAEIEAMRRERAA